ncbi:thiol reductant ABC exporter subunit CydD [Oleiagrimonas sp.]|jgi:ATP-binding cassette subfamily C protein CydD|uniref:thiol reductant ABC exporter subunit CydD n=1 Tax=Oleiagrimonas sp. TaxID=2010330 RepID=UPI0026213021|nr:thiol reductant ABC exporter subunit CydD [Oleiagrimonas sp.]MDA3913624.1 thiol reductant ABC exporter subunit CydD [Oleiagrimonas sp.]
MTTTPSPMAWLRAQARPQRRLLFAGVALGATQALLLCIGAWLVARILAHAILDRSGLRMFWPALAALAGIAVLRFIMTLAQRRLTFEAGARVSIQVRNALETQLRRRGTQQSSGELVTRLVDGIDALAPYYSRYLPQLAFAALVPALLLLAVLPADPWSALILFVTAPLIPVFMILAGRAAQQASQRRWDRLKRLGERFMDALGGLTTLRLLRAVEREQAQLAVAGEAYRRETMAVLRVAFLSALVLEFFATVSIAVVAVLIGFRLLWGTLGFEQGLFVLLLAPEFYLPLRVLGAQRHQRMDAASAAEDLVAWLQKPHATDPVATRMTHAPRSMAPVAMRFEHVAFGLDERMILQDIDFSVAAGESITLVGASGCGKSTLLDLVMGFGQPDSGRIRIDGNDLEASDIADWRARIAWVPQRPHVFQGSLRDNLLLAAPDADTQAIARAVQAAVLGPVIKRLPLGLDTPLGERGRGLSGGECQRLALARAWLRDASLLLLDEPTQHLDTTTAQAVDKALERLAAGRTVLRVAHRLEAIDDRDTVLVMAHGRIVERGTAGGLREAGGVFADLLAADLAA